MFVIFVTRGFPRYNTVREGETVAKFTYILRLSVGRGQSVKDCLAGGEVAKVLRRFGLCLTVLLQFCAASSSAQEWAEKMFEKTDHDFGTVARGADTVYRFEITNIYKQDMVIESVTSSCGCTSPSVENDTIKTWEKAYIVAKFNTRTHIGRKGATLTVRFGAPYRASVQLHVKGNIRSDVVFSPGAVEFGEVDAGEMSEQRVTLTYAGRSDWRIVDVMNDNDHFEVELSERGRSGGRVSYDLLVRLKDNVPAGYLKDQLTVVTNDHIQQNSRIPLFVSGRVRPEFTVTPEQLILGEIAPGQEVTKRIIVRGKNPFSIVDVTCGEDCFTFQTDNESKALHFVDVTFRAGDNPGKLQTPIKILTDRGENRGATCVASAVVSEPKLSSDADVSQAEFRESVR